MNKAEFQKRYGSQIRKPKLSLLLGEVAAPLEAIKLAASWSFLNRKDVGQGQTVLLLPGFGTYPSSMGVLKRYLDSIGYKTHHWSAGFNSGEVGKLLPQVLDDIKRLSSETEGPIKLLGWSLGGYLAREAAREVQQSVSRIVTMGSPVIGGPKYTAVKPLYDMRGTDVDSVENSTLKRFENPIVCPIVALYSKKDSIVSWQACIDRFSPNVEHIEIKSTHLSMGVSKEVIELLPYAMGTPLR
jgi:esterase/lipase